MKSMLSLDDELEVVQERERERESPFRLVRAYENIRFP